jgi:hypothetical protein
MVCSILKTPSRYCSPSNDPQFRKTLSFSLTEEGPRRLTLHLLPLCEDRADGVLSLLDLHLYPLLGGGVGQVTLQHLLQILQKRKAFLSNYRFGLER